MNPAIRTMAKANEENRFLIRYWLPLKKITLEPVTDISCLSLGNIVSIFLYREYFFGSDIFHPEIHSYFLHG